MKQLRPVLALMAATLVCCWSASAFACDKTKNSATSAAMTKGDCPVTASCPASACMGHGAKGASAVTASAQQCTPEMMEACKAAKAAGANISCSMDGKSAMTAAAMGAAGKGKVSAMPAGGDGCCAAGAKTTAMTAGGPSCSGHAGAKTTAMAAGGPSCSGHAGAKTTAMAAGGPSCSGHAGAKTAHAGCSFCEDLSSCDQEMRSLGAVTQVVPLKNGVMFVYTSDATKVRSVQAAMARRKDTMAVFASTPPAQKLCSECKSLRGAAASGKLSREIVNIDSGCLTLMTSSDPSVVARIHELAGVSATRVKS